MANSTRAVTDTGHVIAGTSTTAADTGDGNITVTAVTAADGYDSGGDDTPALRQEVTRLRQLIDILDNIRIYSLPLINDCHCQRQSSPARLQKYRRFNAIYEDLKASHLRSPIKRNNYHPIIISGAIAAANDGRACSVDTGGDDSTDITVEIVSVADDNDQQSDVDVVDTKHYDLNAETETDENEENIAVDPNPNVPPLTQWPPLATNTTATDSTCTIVGALYTCYECDHDFPTQLDLDVHTERIHLTGDEAVGVAVHSYVCDKCYEVFDTEDRLHRHYSQRHRTKRLFGCDQCPYKTLSEKYLLRHKAGYHSPRGSPARKASPYKSPPKTPLRSPPKLKHRSPQRSPQKSPRSVDTNTALVESIIVENNSLQLTPKKAKKSINDLSPSKPSLFEVSESESNSPQRRSKRQASARQTLATSDIKTSPLPATCQVIVKRAANTGRTSTLRKRIPQPSPAASVNGSPPKRTFSTGAVTANTSTTAITAVATSTTDSSPATETVVNINGLDVKVKPSANHSCPKCHHLFPTEIKLLNHLSYKHHVLSFVCHMCGYKTNKKFYLERHMSIHTSAKPYQCDQCRKWFKTRGILLTHKRQTHAPHKRFQCDLCEYRTANKNSLANHKSRHSTDKPFKCEVDDCRKEFKTAICLYQHKSVVHSGDRFECHYEDCRRLYNCKKALVQHLAIHAVAVPYACGIYGCPKTFKEKRSLKRHQIGVHKRVVTTGRAVSAVTGAHK